jgi:cysteine desulfuration protein SufE
MLSKIEEEIIEDFELFDDAMDKYEHIISLGNELPPLADMYKVDALLVRGCQSKVWLHSFEKDGFIYFEADSNTVITKGIVAMLVKVLSGLKPKELAEHPLNFIPKIHLHEHLSSQRSNGLSAMINQMKGFAQSYI